MSDRPAFPAPAPTIDLTACDREPIHVIGRIQSFGWLISFSSDWICNHVSHNCTELTGREPAELIGSPAIEFLDGEALHDIRSRLQMLGLPDSVERIFELDLLGDGRMFDLSVHMSGRSYIIECELSAPGKRRDYVGYVRPMIDRMRRAPTMDKLCALAARQLRGLTGFDRVLVYRFDRTGAGEVIAESIANRAESYLGLHFPASDIPAQARALYARNILRIISDVDDPTVPIVPTLDPNGEPLDLSMSGLRAVSPVHIQYLRNMGVRASMSVSIMRRGALWGMMTRHHRSPLRLPYTMRTAAELFGEFFSYMLEQSEADHQLRHRARSNQLHDEIMARLAGGDSLLSAFEDFAETIAGVIPFDGIVAWVDGEFVARGMAPSQEEFIALTRFLNTAGAGAAWQTDNLSAVYPPAAAYAERCAGLLALPVMRRPRDYIVLFRKEYPHDVSWAGNPDKPVEPGPGGDRLLPRTSFAIWKEERRGRSRPWHVDEIATAESLRITLVEVVLRLADAAHRERQQAGKRQDFLIAELNHRVRNILNLIRGLVSQSRSGAESIEHFSEIVGTRIYALARAHDQLTQTNGAASSLRRLIRTQSVAYDNRSHARLRLTGPDALIVPNAFTPLALVFHELMTNSCKYGAMCNDSGLVSVDTARAADGSLIVRWTETGGPPVRPPTRRGFGSTIIEQTVPHELGGTSRVEYHADGLLAELVIPAEHIAGYDEATEPAIATNPAPPMPVALSHEAKGIALVLEDNMIIAMETEQTLLDLGFENCHIAGSVSDASVIVSSGEIAFAVLDVNLGRNETSEPIARMLAENDIPFVFASGYGEYAGLTNLFDGVPVITKPFTAREMLVGLRQLRLA